MNVLFALVIVAVLVTAGVVVSRSSSKKGTSGPKTGGQGPSDSPSGPIADE